MMRQIFALLAIFASASAFVPAASTAGKYRDVTGRKGGTRRTLVWMDGWMDTRGRTTTTRGRGVSLSLSLALLR